MPYAIKFQVRFQDGNDGEVICTPPISSVFAAPDDDQARVLADAAFDELYAEHGDAMVNVRLVHVRQVDWRPSRQ